MIMLSTESTGRDQLDLAPSYSSVVNETHQNHTTYKESTNKICQKLKQIDCNIFLLSLIHIVTLITLFINIWQQNSYQNFDFMTKQLCD